MHKTFLWLQPCWNTARTQVLETRKVKPGVVTRISSSSSWGASNTLRKGLQTSTLIAVGFLQVKIWKNYKVLQMVIRTQPLHSPPTRVSEQEQMCWCLSPLWLYFGTIPEEALVPAWTSSLCIPKKAGHRNKKNNWWRGVITVPAWWRVVTSKVGLFFAHPLIQEGALVQSAKDTDKSAIFLFCLWIYTGVSFKWKSLWLSVMGIRSSWPSGFLTGA